jgi:hypothetical protein
MVIALYVFKGQVHLNYNEDSNEQVLVDAELFNNGDLGDDDVGVGGRGADLYIFNKGEYPYK